MNLNCAYHMTSMQSDVLNLVTFHLWQLDCHETKDGGSFAPKRALPIVQQMELLGRPVGTYSLFLGLLQTKYTFYMATFNRMVGNSLVTTN